MPQMLSSVLPSRILVSQAIGHTDQCPWSAMGEHMETAVEHCGRPRHPAWSQSFQQRGQVFSRMGKSRIRTASAR
jgi:hypothetical protein